jgi:hypothetical protein
MAEKNEPVLMTMEVLGSKGAMKCGGSPGTVISRGGGGGAALLKGVKIQNCSLSQM